MNVAIMQPYFFPYIGYFQLLRAAELFVLYDNVKYTKKGWINRNRILQNGKDVVFSLPLRRASDASAIGDRDIAPSFNRDRLLNQLRGAYGQATYFDQTFPLIERIVSYGETNLFRFLHHSIVATADHLGITPEIRVASGIAIDHAAKGQERVLALCEAVGATTYVNAIGGMTLYAREDFLERGIELRFLRSKPFEYPQFGGAFVPWLSIIDVMMFNPRDVIRTDLVERYELI